VAERHGARIEFHKDDVIQIIRTVKRGENPGRYVIDHDSSGRQKDKFVNPGDDQLLVEAILSAGRGEL